MPPGASPSDPPEELQPYSDEVIDKVLSNEDLLKTLLCYLDVVDISRAAVVCKFWRQVCDSDEFWTRVAFDSRPISRDQVCVCVCVSVCL